LAQASLPLPLPLALALAELLLRRAVWRLVPLAAWVP
jgi:hypothetical protein